MSLNIMQLTNYVRDIFIRILFENIGRYPELDFEDIIFINSAVILGVRDSMKKRTFLSIIDRYVLKIIEN